MRVSSFLVGGSVALLVALGSYGSAGCDMLATSSCDGGTHTSASDLVNLLPLQTAQLRDSTCSTCGHESIQVSWNIDKSLPILGNVQIEADGSCNGIAVQPYIVTLEPSAEGGSAEPPNLKNLCGESAAESWVVTVTNFSTLNISNLRINLTCPTFKEATPVLASPSRLSIRGSN